VGTCHHNKPMEITNVNDSELKVGATGASVEVNGTGFEAGARVNLGSGITINQGDIKVEADGTRLTFTADVDSRVQPGYRTLTVTNLDCSTATKQVTIGPGAASASPTPANPTYTVTQPEPAKPAARPAPTSPAPATRPASTEKPASKRGRRKEEG
jgi:hypothetical protein